ncbi:MAG: hypothetical protein IKA02_04235 [Clostridia bacterium]|nr:hypothetical protein [Clostridia bacterium]
MNKKAEKKTNQTIQQNVEQNTEQNTEQIIEQNEEQNRKQETRRIIIVVCDSEYVSNLPEGTKTTLFGAKLDEHAHRKIMDAVNKLGINAKFLSADVFDNKNNTQDLAQKVDRKDIIAVVSPFVFLAPAKVIEEAISSVINQKDTVCTVGNELDYYGAFALGDMIVSGYEITTCAGFVYATTKTGAIYKYKKLMENEVASPVSRIDYFKKVEEYRNDILDYIIMSGVTIENRDGVIISPSCVVRAGTKILPNTQIYNDSLIKENCVIGPNTEIINSEIGEKSTIESSKVSDSVLGYNVTVESHCTLKNNCQLDSGVKIYSGCSIENSSIGINTSVYQNTNLVETKTGQRVVIGSGTVTVKPVSNMAKSKTYQCRIGNYAIIGCNSTLIQPIEIGNNALVAAGSVITDNIPDDAFAIAREFQETKENKAKKRKRF